MVGIEVRKQYGDKFLKTKLLKFLQDHPEHFEVVPDEDNKKVFFVKIPYDNKDYVKAVWNCIDKCSKNQDGNILVNEIGIQLSKEHGKKFLPTSLLKFLRDNPDDFNVIESNTDKDVYYVSRDKSNHRDTKYIEAVTSCINKCNPVKGRYVLVNEVGIKLSNMYGKDYLPYPLGKFLRNNSENFTIGYHTETNALIVKTVLSK